MDRRLRTLADGTVPVSDSELAGLRAGLRGSALLPGETGYDEARTIWNAMIDRRPGLIVRAMGAADVMATVAFASQRGLVLSVRGGGHNIAGNAVCEGGVMLDLSLMRSVRVDPAARRAHVAGGALLSDVDKETQAFGLMVPTGINSTTGIAGLTLGGGFGWTSRAFGLAVDNLLSVDVVTADGTLRRADAGQHPDLFWAVRGGGGNFGVATSFEFQLHSLGPQVIAGLVLHPLAEATAVMREYRRLLAAAPDALSVWLVLRQAPPASFVPAAWHGREILVMALCHTGPLADAEASVAPFRAIGAPIADLVGPHPFVGWQQAFDPLLAPGARNYWKSHDLRELSDAAWEILLDAAQRLPTSESEVFIGQLGGRINRVPADATAFSRRDVAFVVNIHTRWRDPAQDPACIDWSRKLFQALAPQAMGSVYVNFMPADEADRIPGAYGANLARLAEIKRRYDPGNLFRLNQNIALAKAPTA